MGSFQGAKTLDFELQQPVMCVVGPTASGKSDLAQQLALKLHGEVISADSMQIYRGMDIGTGKVPKKDRLVTHHGLDIVDPGEPFSAALFQEYARKAFRTIEKRGKRSVLCGGTGFYIRAAIDDYRFPSGDQVDNPIREQWTTFAREHGAHKLWLELMSIDPKSAHIIPESDVKRVVRAFELLESGTTYATQKENLQHIAQIIPAVLVGLKIDEEVLKERINNRVERMIEAGLIEEVQALLSKGFREGITSPQAIGYKEIVAALEGTCSMDEAIESIKVSTRRYAKRQRTWFRKDKRIHWIEATQLQLDEITKEALSYVATITANGKG